MHMGELRERYGRWQMRRLAKRLARQPTTCRWMWCENPLPPVPVEREFCSDECAYQDWLNASA